MKLVLIVGAVLTVASFGLALPMPAPAPVDVARSTPTVVTMPHDAQHNGFLPANAVVSDGFVTFSHVDTTFDTHQPITDQAPPPAGCFFDAGFMNVGSNVIIDLTGCPSGTVIHYSCYIHFLADGTPAMLGTITIA